MRISLRTSHRGAEAVVQSREGRKGIALVEVIVAMVLLAVAVSSLAGLVWSVSQSGVRTSGDAYKNGVLMQEVNRLEGTPYDSIPTGITTYTVSSGTYAHTRTITVAEPVLQKVKTIRIVVTPTNARFKADTVNFTRTKAKTSKVLCTVCQ